LAEEAGLTQEPATLLISTNKAAFVPEILGQLETLLLDLNRLKERDGLRLQPTSEGVEALDVEDSTLSKLDIIGHEYEQTPSKVAIAAVARLKQTRLKLGSQIHHPW
jgi:hypothetical protein